MKKLGVMVFIFAMLFNLVCFAEGWILDGGDWKYQDRNGDFLTDTIKKSLDQSYYLDDNGFMVRDYLAEIDGRFYYFNENGEMVTNTWVAIDPDMIDDKYFDADAYFMYFGNNGRAYAGDEGKVKSIDGKYYMFNDRGIMMVGWMTENGEYLESESSDDWYSSEATYYAHEDGSLAEGWVALSDYFIEDGITNAAGDELDLERIYFYFNPSTHKKTTGEKTINGKKYRFFTDNGRMMTSWEYLETAYGGGDNSFKATESSYNMYYNLADDGSLSKNSWIYAVPSTVIDSSAYDDEDGKWFYSKANGSLIADSYKKINSKNYIFDRKGIMRTGLILMYNNKYYCAIDLEETTYEDLVMNFRAKVEDDTLRDDIEFISGTDATVINSGIDVLDSDGYIRSLAFFKGMAGDLAKFTFRYFGDDGAELRGKDITIPFADREYTFAADNKGAYREWKDDYYYINGFKAVPQEELEYGLLVDWPQAFEGSVDTDGLNLYFSGGGEPEERIFTKYTNLDQKMVNYGHNWAEMNLSARDNPNEEINTIELQETQAGYTPYGDVKKTGRPLWHMHLPIGVLKYTVNNYDEGQRELRIGDISFCNPKKAKNFINLIDRKGKRLGKGAYRDFEDNYWFVDSNKQFIGLFSVPVKWNGKEEEECYRVERDGSMTPLGTKYSYDVPYYKSYAVGSNGNESKKWIKFGEKDAYGKTEVDYVVPITDEYCIDFRIGDAIIGLNIWN